MTNFEKIKFLVVDDHYHFRKGIIATLSFVGVETSNVCEAVNGFEAVQLALSRFFDIILMDINMPVMNGLEASSIILERKSITKIIVVTMYDDEALIRNLVHIGVLGILPKNLGPEQLVAALQAILKGERFLNGRSMASSCEFPPGAKCPYLNLTDREKKLIKMIHEGRSNKQIATEQRMTVRSVESCRYRLMKKIGVRSTTELLRYTSSSGLISS